APTVQGQIRRNERVLRHTALLSLLNDGSDDIIVVANDPDARYPDVYRMNTRTGRKSLKSYGKPGDIGRWIADRNGSVRAAVEVEKGTIVRVFWRPDEDAKWVLLLESDHKDVPFTPVAFDGDGTLLVAS